MALFSPACPICSLTPAQNGSNHGAIKPKSRAIDSANSGTVKAAATSSLRRFSASSPARAAASMSTPSPPAASAVSITPYPARSTAALSSSQFVAVGRYATLACSLARFTLASSTPGVLRSARSIRLAQEAQVIPVTGNSIRSETTP